MTGKNTDRQGNGFFWTQTLATLNLRRG